MTEEDTRKKILFAEDEKLLRDIFSRIVQKEFPNYEFESFSDGTSLESKLNNGIENVVLVLTDNIIPGISGSEIIKKYASRPEFKRIPFVLCYGGDESIGEKAVEDGAFCYVLKPYLPSDIKEVVRASLESFGSVF